MNHLILSQNNPLTEFSGICDPLLREAFLNSLDVKDFSRQLYARNLERFFTYLNFKQIMMPSRDDIIQYKNYLLQNNKPTTVNTYYAPVRQFFKFTADLGVYPNIATGIKNVRDNKENKKEALSAFQLKRLFKYLSSLESTMSVRDYTIIHLMIRTGLRDIEVCRADVGDIGTKSGKMVLYVWGKARNSKDDFVVLTEDTYDMLLDYLKSRGYPDEKEPLFISLSRRNQNGRLTTRSVSRIVKNALKGCGLNSVKLTAHSLRHTAVTLSLLGGATIQETQAMARHANIETTMRYAHNINRVENAAEHKIDQFLKEL